MPFAAAEGTLSGQHHNIGHLNHKLSKVDGLAPARGILIGLALSMSFWIVVLAAWCL